MPDKFGVCEAGLGLKVLGPGVVELLMNGVGAYVGRLREDDPPGAGVTGVATGGMNSCGAGGWVAPRGVASCRDTTGGGIGVCRGGCGAGGLVAAVKDTD